jgi:hypothetical protein
MESMAIFSCSSYFFLFVPMIRIRGGRFFRSADDFMPEIQVILALREKLPCLTFSAEWMRRLQQCRDINGNYIE